MVNHTQSFDSVPQELVELLTAELPYSLPLLRRLQFTKFPQGTSEHARVIFISATELSSRPDVYTAAYLDFSKSGTQMFVYSTLEHPRNGYDSSNDGTYEEQVAELVGQVIRLRKEYGKELLFTNPERILVGTLHSKIRSILETFDGRVESRPSGLFDKWLMKRDELPVLGDDLPPGMEWGSASLDDCRIICSRTDIPRTPEELVHLPNLTIKLEDKTPIVWGLVGIDGSLISIHCEEPYRRQGLAKKLAAKLLREKSTLSASDGLIAADVSPTNASSRAMCKALGGKPDWTTSWICLILSEPETPSNLN
ncbi:uncharacterized protein TrAtP1_002744 [Trichoderma atroviride]|uniref:uncharacterized protein n=1 Tax=Hypocrea atroviridis TaxID=63577 RepID=UPI0033218E54|nr:hypothetical protein TrAtP1_002744 [Trichoderma atroviride]